MLKFRSLIAPVFVILLIILSGCSTSFVRADARIVSPEDFSQKISRLQVGDVVDVTTDNRVNVELEIVGVGHDYIEGYVSDPVMPEDEWWTTRYYFKEIEVIDDVIVPVDALPNPVVQASADGVLEEAGLTIFDGIAVNDEVEITTIYGETVRMRVVEVSEESIRGAIFMNHQHATEKTDFSREEIARIKAYIIPKSARRSGKVAAAIGKGLGVVLLVGVRLFVGLLFAAGAFFAAF